jgi:sugar lactone lactonase YvrE
MQPGLFAPFRRVGHTSVNGSERIPLHDQASYPPQFAGAFYKRLSRIACSSLMLLALAAPLPAVDMLYVSMNNTIVSYDTSSGVAATIAASMNTFASTNLSTPLGLAFDPSGNLYSVNNGNATISKFNASGGYVSNISSNLNGPQCLAFDSSGNLYVTNYNNSTISKFNASGTFLSQINSNLSGPVGLAFDSTGNLYASNVNNDTISKFNASGGFVSIINSTLSGTYALAFDSSDNLYAANYNNNSISKFNSAGTFLSQINSNLSGPAGLAFDSSGNLYAANYNNNSISKFNSTGTFLTSWSTGSNPNYLAFKPVTVPEPSTYALATIATGVMAYLARRRKSRTA